jgi:hypothetical protein
MGLRQPTEGWNGSDAIDRRTGQCEENTRQDDDEMSEEHQMKWDGVEIVCTSTSVTPAQL